MILPSNDSTRLLALLVTVVLLALPLGNHLARLYNGKSTMLTALLGPCERFLYRLCGVDPNDDMGWQRYAMAMLLLNLILFAVLLAALLAHPLPALGPSGLQSLSWPLALHTAIHFSNTSWQQPNGGITLTLNNLLVGFAVRSFVSTASAMAVAAAVIRGIVRRTTTIGNFWVDLIHSALYVLLPLSLLATFLLAFFETTPTPSFPGGIANVLVTTPPADFVRTLLLLLIPAAFGRAFGIMAGKPKQGWVLLAVVFFLSTAIVGVHPRQETGADKPVTTQPADGRLSHLL